MTVQPVPAAHLPPGYPTDLERRLTLRDGRRVYVRPILPDDAALLRFEIDRLDAETLYHRFFTYNPGLTDEKLRYLAGVDYRRRLALVALDEKGEGLAVVRYEGLPDSTDAEVAFTVKPAWRRAGLASTMLTILEAAAKDRGIERFTAVYLAENHAAAGVLAGAGFNRPRVTAGTAETEKHLG